jgi:ribonuclease Z
MNIYGPVGLRKFIRTQLEITKVTLTGAFAVHELVPAGEVGSCTCNVEDLHVNEAVGRDIYPNAEGVWDHIVDEALHKGQKGWSVNAGPLIHRGELGS